jgi:phosphatidylglycerol---prolipoprotein diacylglyceryl transferase
MPLRAMIPYAPHPILFQIGPLAIRYYSLAYLIGFVLSYLALKKRYGKEKAEDLTTWIIVSVILGGRLGYFLFYSPATFIQDPLEVLYIWHGGMSFHGAFIAVVFALWLYGRQTKTPLLQIGDVIALPAAIGLALGRVANFLNGELVGTVTNVPWCMQFPGYLGCRHPSQLYEAVYMLIIAAVLYWQLRKKHEQGFIALLFIFLYGVFRFTFNFVRDDPRVLGISEGQWLSLAMILVAGWLLATKYKKSLAGMLA